MPSSGGHLRHCIPASRKQRHLTGRRTQGRKTIKMDAETQMHQIFIASILRPAQREENAYMGILLPSLYIVKCRLDRERDSVNLQHAIPPVEALLKRLNTKFINFYAYMDVLMATPLHPHYTSVVLKKIAPDSMAAVKEKLVNELKTAIVFADCAEPDEQQPAPSEARSEDFLRTQIPWGFLTTTLTEIGGSLARSSPRSWMNDSVRKTRLHSARSCSPRNTGRRG